MTNILDLRSEEKVKEFKEQALTTAKDYAGNHPLLGLFETQERHYEDMTLKQSFAYFNGLMQFTMYEQLKYVDYSLFSDIFLIKDEEMIEYIDNLSNIDWSEELGYGIKPFIKVDDRWKCTDFGLNALIMKMSWLGENVEGYKHEEIGGLVISMLDYNRERYNTNMLDIYMLDESLELQEEKVSDNRDRLLMAEKYVREFGVASFDVKEVYKLIEEVFEIKDVENILTSNHSPVMKHCISLIEYHIADIVGRCVLFADIEKDESQYGLNIVEGFDTLLEHFRNLPWSKELPELVYVSFKGKELRFKEPKEKEGREKC